ncbi:hypothetical protein HCX48_11300 [Rhodocyclus tenuis]|uniref:Glycine zipper domain-containing protein n=1 Tax=Rhodocyclus gracilis TaxID=2929842 RepID=A0ABX0WMJ7_9RHOO|nr:hypothetical protein [Rhodocyclus gracilis]MRD73719.1 hypothetical protein [Rhodocyclus gracilis]NJA89805.1 hypothetical protein [Rhodocyclus gracilis]
MNAKYVFLPVVSVAVLMSGCAQMQEKTGMDDKAASTVGGAAIGCAAGALLAHLTGHNAAGGCAAGMVVGGLVGFEKARQAEIAAAEQTRKETVAALATLPPAQANAVTVGEVRTVEVTATDKVTNQKKKYAAFDSVSVDMPTSAKGTPEYEAAMGKLKTLAERVADDRGSSEIIVSVNSGDAKAQKIALESNSVKTKAGNPITVIKRVDPSLARGMQRITVKAGSLNTNV